MDADGTEHQKSEGYTTLKEAEKRKKEIEYKQSLGTFVVPKCTKVKELIKEYVRIYGHNEWGVINIILALTLLECIWGMLR